MEADTHDSVWKSKTVQIVLFCTFLAPLGVPLVSPALPSIQSQFGVTETSASLLVSSYFLVGIFLSPFIGILVDRVGRKKVLIVSLFVFSISGSIIYLLDTFSLILILRFIQGTSAAGLFITTVTLISDMFDGVKRNAVLGLNGAALSIGAVIFPVVGGILVSISWNTPFLAYLLPLPLAVFTWRFLEAPMEDVTEQFEKSYLTKTLHMLARKEMMLPYASSVLTELLLFGIIFTLLPFILVDMFDASPIMIGVMVAVTSIASAIAASQSGKIAQFLSNHQIMAAGITCYGIAIVGIWSTLSLLVVSASVILFGAGIGLSMPAVDSAIGDFIDMRYRGGALSIRNSTTFLGRAAGPLLFAAAARMIGRLNLLLTAAVLVLLFALLLSMSCTFQIRDSKICLRRNP